MYALGGVDRVIRRERKNRTFSPHNLSDDRTTTPDLFCLGSFERRRKSSVSYLLYVWGWKSFNSFLFFIVEGPRETISFLEDPFNLFSSSVRIFHPTPLVPTKSEKILLSVTIFYYFVKDIVKVPFTRVPKKFPLYIKTCIFLIFL